MMEDQLGELSIDKVILFVIFALPGLVAIRVYTMRFPGPPKDLKESIVDSVTYSFFNLLTWRFLFPTVVRRYLDAVFDQQSGKQTTPETANLVFADFLNLFLYVLVTPALTAFFWHLLRAKVLPRLFGFDHPVRTAWDWAFARKESFYVIFFMKTKAADGSAKQKAGYFGGNSYVSAYPIEPEIFLERTHITNKDGSLGQPIPGSAGLLVKMSECESIEFLRDPAFLQNPGIVTRAYRNAFRPCFVGIRRALKWLRNPVWQSQT
jgi:Family of unknown function (DUF6338)